MTQKFARAIAVGLATVMAGGCSGGSGSVATPVANQRTAPAPPANSAPVISGMPGSAATVNQQYAFLPNASDSNGDNLSFSIVNGPSWATFDPGTGSLSGTPAPGDAAVYDDIRISVSDGSITSSLPAFSIMVSQAAPGSVTLTWTAPTMNTDGTTLTDLNGYTVYYGTAPGSYPNNIEISNAGITTYVIDNLSPNTYYFVLTSLNGQDVESAFSNEAMTTIP